MSGSFLAASFAFDPKLVNRFHHQGNLPRTSKIEGSPIVFHVNSFIRRSHSEGKGEEESPIEENDVDSE